MRRAPATTILIALILVVFGIDLVLMSRGAWPLAVYGAVVPKAILHRHEYWRLVTAIFLHGGVLHLVVNLIALFQLGRLYEMMFGTSRFLLIYFVAGIGGTIASTLRNAGPSVGASGAIFGILGAFIFSVRRSPLWRDNRVARSIVNQCIFWMIANILIGLQIEQIDNAAHIGGLVTGLALGAVLPHRAPPPPPSTVVYDVRPYEGSAEDPAARTDDRSPRE